MLSAGDYERYRREVAAIAARAEREADAILSEFWLSDGEARRDVLASVIRTFVPELAETYGSAAADVSADLWEEIYGSATGVSVEAVVPDDDADARADSLVGHALGRLADGGATLAANAVRMGVAGMVRDAARQTQLQNTRRVRDRRMRGWQGARFARIPTGDTTCAFCMMLASRGFVYLSRESAGEFDKYHEDCDCVVVSSFDGDEAAVEGYDPSEYLAMYKDAIVRGGTGAIDTRATLANMRQMYGLK